MFRKIFDKTTIFECLLFFLIFLVVFITTEFFSLFLSLAALIFILMRSIGVVIIADKFLKTSKPFYFEDAQKILKIILFTYVFLIALFTPIAVNRWEWAREIIFWPTL